jgi:hypothetical protein
MLAYIFWHRPYETTTVKQYEEALLRFQQPAAWHSVASGSRRAAPATPATDFMAASDGARSRQGVRSDRAAGRQCSRTSRLVRAGHRAGARRCAEQRAARKTIRSASFNARLTRSILSRASGCWLGSPKRPGEPGRFECGSRFSHTATSACFTYLRLLDRSGLLDHLSSDCFDYRSGGLFHFPRNLLHRRGFGLGLCNRPLRSFGYFACLTAFS